MMFARRYDDAIALAERGLELDPNFAISYLFKGVAYAQQGRFDEALTNVQKAVQLDPNPHIVGMAALVHALAGQKSEAERMVKEVEKHASHRYFCPFEIATAYVSLNDFDTATKWFRKGVEDRSDCMAWLGVEPWIEPFRSDPRYAQLLRDVGLAAPASAMPRK